MINVLAFDNVKKQVTLSLEEFKRIQADLKELQAIADKWTDAQTQEDLYLGRCLRLAYSKGAFLIYDVVEDAQQNIISYNSDSDLYDVLEWDKSKVVE